MKVLSVEKVRLADQFTIENEPVKPVDLMERASAAFVDKFQELLEEKKSVRIFCGTGNNGGDGLAIARLLMGEGYSVVAYVCGNIEKGSEDFKTNLKRLSSYELIEKKNDFPLVEKNEIIIDGLFGSGLTRSIHGVFADLITHLNQCESSRISIDIASGLYADQPVEENAVVFHPHHTVSFQLPKLVFFLPGMHDFVGDWHLVDIGLDTGFISDQLTEFCLTEKAELTNLPKPGKFSHKSQHGRLMIAAGSKGMMGAATLCTRAALRAGIGLVKVHLPKCGTGIMQISVPEAMVIEDLQEEYVSNIPSSDFTFAIGPGIGTHQKTQEALVEFLERQNDPVVLDADAINIMSLNPEFLEMIPEDSVLTPHPGEFRRLVGEWENDFDKLEKLKSFCVRYKVNVVLKGAYSAVCNSDGVVHFNSTGNPGLATPGSGDVLTGIVSSFLAQGLKPFEALKSGVFIHGLAGDLAAEELGERSMIASDIILKISNAIQLISVSNPSSQE